MHISGPILLLWGARRGILREKEHQQPVCNLRKWPGERKNTSSSLYNAPETPFSLPPFPSFKFYQLVLLFVLFCCLAENKLGLWCKGEHSAKLPIAFLPHSLRTCTKICVNFQRWRNFYEFLE